MCRLLILHTEELTNFGGKVGHLDGEKILLRRFQLEELERATNNFSRDRLVGTGGFGNVYRGTFDLEGTLAIKKAHADSYKSVEEFRNGKPRVTASLVLALGIKIGKRREIKREK